MALCPEPPVPHRRRPVRPGAVPGQPHPGGGLECPAYGLHFSLPLGRSWGCWAAPSPCSCWGRWCSGDLRGAEDPRITLSRLVCLGTGAALIFQVCVNVGMCLGVAPVIGLTLPSSATAAAPSSPCIWPWVWSPASTPTPGRKPEAATSSLPYHQMFEFKARESSLDRSGWNIYNKGEKFHF